MKIEVPGLKFRIPLRWKISGLILLLLVLVMVAIRLGPIDNMTVKLTEGLIRSGGVVLNSMIRSAGDALTSNDTLTLQTLATDAIKKNKNLVLYAYVMDESSKVKAYAASDPSGEPLKGAVLTEAQAKIFDKPYKEVRSLRPYPIADTESTAKVAKVIGQDILDIEQPVIVYGKFVGLAKIGLNLKQINEAILETLRLAFWFTMGIGVIGMIGALLLAHYLVVPIRLLVQGTLEMVKGHFNVRVPIKSHDELGDLTIAFNNMAGGLEQREKMKTAFGRMVSKDVFGEMMGDLDNVKVRGEKKHITILFSDVRGFTTISEGMKPEQVTELLNEYFEEMVAIVLKNHGTLDKFIGDGLMALFGAPKSYGNDAVNAANAMLEMRETVDRLNAKWIAEGRQPIRIGVGLNTGEVTAGFIGSSKKMEYSVIGDAVNLASRIEGLNKDFKTTTLLSEFTYQEIKDHFETRELDAVKVKGKERATKIYELVSRKPVPAA